MARYLLCHRVPFTQPPGCLRDMLFLRYNQESCFQASSYSTCISVINQKLNFYCLPLVRTCVICIWPSVRAYCLGCWFSVTRLFSRQLEISQQHIANTFHHQHEAYCLCYWPAARSLCGVAQLVARRLAGRQARVRFTARHHKEVCPTELTSDEEMKRGLGKCIVWMWLGDCMYVRKYEK